MSPRDSQGIPRSRGDSKEFLGSSRDSQSLTNSQGFPGSLSPRDSQEVTRIPRRSSGVPNSTIVFYYFLLETNLSLNKTRKKLRKAQEAPGSSESPGKARKPKEGQGRPGTSSWEFPGHSWGSLGLVPSLGLPGSPGLPGSLGSLGSREVRGSTGFDLPRHPSRALQKILGPPEKGRQGASIKGASIRGFY